MRLKAELELAVFDKRGILIHQQRQEVRSWLRHFFDLFYVQTYGAGLNINDIGGAARAVIFKHCTLGVGAPPGAVLAAVPIWTTIPAFPYLTPFAGEQLGIVVGTNNTVVAPTDNALYAKVAHGSAPTQLLYGGCELYGLTFVNPNGQFTIRRYFTNVLGGAITIQEAGIYSVGAISDTNAYAFCIARDVVSPGVAVNDTELLRVTYVAQITV